MEFQFAESFTFIINLIGVQIPDNVDIGGLTIIGFQ